MKEHSDKGRCLIALAILEQDFGSNGLQSTALQCVLAYKLEIHIDSPMDYICGWCDYTIGVDNWGNLSSLQHELDQGNIRVLIK